MTLGPPSNHRSISGGLFLRYTYMYRPPLQTNRRCRSKGQEKEKAICYRQKLDRYRPACFFSPAELASARFSLRCAHERYCFHGRPMQNRWRRRGEGEIQRIHYDVNQRSRYKTSLIRHSLMHNFLIPKRKKENDMHFVFVFFHVSRRVDKGSFFSNRRERGE